MIDKTSNNRIEYLDKLRVIAIFMVLYCHSGSGCVLSYNNTDIFILRFLSILLYGVSQCCICLFFLISGAVLLRKQESVKTILLKRFLPMLGITAFVVLFQCIYNMLAYGYSITVKDIAVYFYSGGAIYEQWFLYSYLAFLLCLPVLQRLASALTDDIFRYLFVLLLIFTIIAPMAEAIFDIPGIGIEIPLFAVIIFYPLFGYYLENRPHEKLFSKNGKWLVGGVFLVTALGNAYMNNHSFENGGILAYSTMFISIYSVCFFVLFHSEKKVANSFWCFAGAGVFGTYLFERQIRAVVSIPLNSLGKFFSPYAKGILEIVFTLALGVIVVNFVKNLINGIIKKNHPA